MQKNIPRIDLDASESSALTELAASCLKDFDSFDDQTFLKKLPIYAHRAPERLIEFLNEFKYGDAEYGYCVISTGAVDGLDLGPTPSHWELATNNETCMAAVMSMCLSATLLGDIFGWLTQQDGRVVHDILPIKKLAHEQLGCGYKEELTWHTEDAFHELRGDYLVMMCLRNDDQIPTTLSKPDYSKLTDRQIDVLFEEHFIIKPDNSHKVKHNSSVRAADSGSDSSSTVSQAYSSIKQREENPDRIAVLFGNKSDPCLRIDPYFMETPETKEAEVALNALIDLVGDSLIEVSLNPGEILVIDNYEVVHGRRPFEAKFDGKDRWYKRINVIRDIRRCIHALDGKKSRIVS